MSLVTVFVLGTAVVFAAKHHNSAQVTTIADIKLTVGTNNVY